MTEAVCRVSATQSQQPWATRPLWAPVLHMRKLRPGEVVVHPRFCLAQAAARGPQLTSVRLRLRCLHADSALRTWGAEAGVSWAGAVRVWG